MKLTGTFVGRRKAAVGKAFYVRELRGQLIACKWPRKRGRPLHPTTLEQNEKFKQANKMAQFAPAEIQIAHRRMSEGTNLLPRDLMISAMYGRGFNFIIANQRRRYPVAARQDLSDTLDILGGEPGDALARGPELWERSRPTAEGQVWTAGAAGAMPTWQNPAGTGGTWTEIADDTLPLDLGVGVQHKIDFPTNSIEMELTIFNKSPGTGQRIALRFNDDNSPEYDWQVMAVQTGSVLRVNRAFNVTSCRPMHTGAGDWASNFVFRMRAIQSEFNEQVYFTGDAIGGNMWHAQFGGRWQKPDSDPWAKIGISSNTGTGLRADTRMILRAVLPIV